MFTVCFTNTSYPYFLVCILLLKISEFNTILLWRKQKNNFSNIHIKQKVFSKIFNSSEQWDDLLKNNLAVKKLNHLNGRM